jgi:hypothetical protein
VDEHLPSEVIAYKMQDPQWCLRQAEAIGHNYHRLIHHLFADQVLDNLQSAQGIIGFAKRYGALLLESACQKALFFDNSRYRRVKSILKQGLAQMSLPTPHSLFPLSVIYMEQARFLRPAVEFHAEASSPNEEGGFMNSLPELNVLLKQLRLPSMWDSLGCAIARPLGTRCLVWIS